MTSHTTNILKRVLIIWSLTALAGILFTILRIYTTEYDNIHRLINLVGGIVALFGGGSLIPVLFTVLDPKENVFKEHTRKFFLGSNIIFVTYLILASFAIIFFSYHLICTSQVKLQLEETATISIIKNNQEKNIAWLPTSDRTFLRLPVGSYRLFAIIKDKDERDTLHRDSVQINLWHNPNPIIIKRNTPVDTTIKDPPPLLTDNTWKDYVVPPQPRKCPQITQYKYCLGPKFMQNTKNTDIEVWVDHKLTDQYELINSLRDFGCTIVKIKACVTAKTIKLKSKSSCEINVLLEEESSKVLIPKDCL